MSDTEPDPSEQRSDESAEDWARRNRVEADKAVEDDEAKEAHEGN